MKNRTIEELKSELASCREEIKHLQSKYDSEIVEARKELDFIKEQLEAQGIMLSDAIDYANALEKELNTLKKEFFSKSQEKA